MDPYHHHLPEVGQTRCYWALLSADLQFIYVDPVLAYHLDTQAEVLIGKSLLSFVHPDEQASAKLDLRGVLESRTLHGSVTRVRLLRLSKVRRNLGHTGPPPIWSDAEKIAIDDNYMAVDIVINWAADGLVLCFIHASVDLDPENDNDETNKSHWTNWCGTPSMPPEQIDLLFRRLLLCVPHSRSPSGTHTRIFQILANQPHRQLLLSWPPDQQGSGPTGRELAKLVENAEMGSGPQKGNDAKTSCTRRYRATQLMSPSLGEVESIFIPHGTVIFACHKVESSVRSTSATNPSTMHHQISYNSNNPSYPSQPGPSYYDSPSSYPPLTPAYSQGYLTHQSLTGQPPPPTSTYSPPRWSQQNYHQSQPPSAHTQWATPSPTNPLSPLPPTSASVPPSSSSMSNPHFRSTSYSTGGQPAPGPPQSSSWHTTPGPYDFGYRGPSPSYGAYSTSTRSTLGGTSILSTPSSMLSATAPGAPPPPPPTTTPSSIADMVPPPKRRVSPGSLRGSGVTPGGAIGNQYASTSTTGSSGRGSGNRPSGILECSSCGATTSPEWRKGPTGKKELCNACGLRYARSRAKKDGGGGTGSSQGRKKKPPTGDPTGSHISANTLPTTGVLKIEPSDFKLNHHSHHHPQPHTHHHIVGGTGSSNGVEIKREFRHRKRESLGGGGISGSGGGVAGGMTPPLATIAAAGGSPGYASTMLRKGCHGLGGSGGSDSFSAGATTSSPATSGENFIAGESHGHAHYAVLAAGGAVTDTGVGGSSEGNGNGTVLTPSPSPPVTGASTSAQAAPVGPSTSTSSGSLGLHISGASPSSSSSPALSVPSLGNGTGPPPPSAAPPTSAPTGATISQSESGSGGQDVGYLHQNTSPTQHERVIPPLNVHSYSQSHSNSSHSHPHSHSHSGSPSGGPNSGAHHPHSPLPSFSAAAHYVHSGYTAKPSPLSQAGNIVTGPGAGPGSGVGSSVGGPLTPLSSVLPHSAVSNEVGGADEAPLSSSPVGGNAHMSGGMQLPPLAYMDRHVQSGSTSGPGHGHHGYNMKFEYGTPESESPSGGGQQQQHGPPGFGAASSMGREPLTPLSAESPIGPGVGRNHHRRTILGGGQ